MDNGQGGSVEVGDPTGSDDASGGSGSFQTSITISGGQCTMDGQPCDINDIFKAIADAYEAQETPDGDEAAYQSGLGSAAGGGGTGGGAGASAGM